MEVEVSQHLGARATSGPASGPGSATGTASGAGTRGWARSRRVPRVRDGSYFPALLGATAASGAGAGGGGAGGGGVCAGRLDAGVDELVRELVQALGLTGISKSQVSAMCQELDAEVERFRARPLARRPLRMSGWMPRS